MTASSDMAKQLQLPIGFLRVGSVQRDVPEGLCKYYATIDHQRP